MSHLLVRASAQSRRSLRALARIRRRYGSLLLVIAVFVIGLVLAYFGRRALSTYKTEVLVGVFGIFITFQLHVWRRHRETIEIASKWYDGEVQQAHQRIVELFPLPWPPSKPLGETDLEAAFATHKDLRGKLNCVLNHLNSIALGYEEGVYPPTLTQHLYGHVLTEFHRHFNAFIKSSMAGSPDQEEPSVTVFWYLNLVGTEWTENRGRWQTERRPAEQRPGESGPLQLGRGA